MVSYINVYHNIYRNERTADNPHLHKNFLNVQFYKESKCKLIKYLKKYTKFPISNLL